jgi:glucose/arabinose dehydrogenase
VHAAVPANFTETLVTSGLSAPTAMTLAPDGRIFVTTQNGALRVIKNGSLLATPFTTLNVDPAGERGLLGVAFDPNYATNRFVYVYYTVPAPVGGSAHNRVARLTADAANPDVAVGPATTILDLEPLSSATNHNGGAIHFGPDGKLYVAVGENANSSNSQLLTNRLGKLLRINPDGTIPGDNPLLGSTVGDNRAIWALGLRNPYTFAFQPGTGRLFIDDVGEGLREEINDGVAGANYGWPDCEGDCNPPNPSYRDPVFSYAHGSTSTTGCAITGGAFYNPSTQQFPPDYTGDFFFADLCRGWIRRFDPVADAATDFASGYSSPVDLVTEPGGSLLVLARGGGAGGSGVVVRIRYQSPTSVTVRGLSARRAAGGTRVSWLAAHDPRLLRFDLYRERAGVRSRVNRTAILPGRSRYAVLDRSRGERYWLRATFTGGTRTWFGPAS